MTGKTQWMGSGPLIAVRFHMTESTFLMEGIDDRCSASIVNPKVRIYGSGITVDGLEPLGARHYREASVTITDVASEPE